MSRIPEMEIEQIKKTIDLAALVRAKGIVLKKHGSDLIGLCPFHDDKNPSLIVTHSKNLWHCYGACQTGGSVIDWVMKSEGVGFRHAFEILRDGKASTLVNSTKILKKTTVPRLVSPVQYDADDQSLLKQVVNYYHETLKKTPKALEYLQKRGIKSEEALITFQLGFSDRTLGIRLPFRNREDGKKIRDRLIKLGIYRESGHEHFSGSLVIPIIDENGIITEIYGRKIRDDLREGTAYHLYLPGQHKGIWNPQCFAMKEIILCESLIDGLTFWVHGFRNVTASYGIQGFTDEHLNAFIERRIQKVYIAYDHDDAGESAALKLAELLIKEGIDCYRICFPLDMDANEYALKAEQAKLQLQVLLNKSIWLGNGKKAIIKIDNEQNTDEIQNIERSEENEKATSTEKNKNAFSTLAANENIAAKDNNNNPDKTTKDNQPNSAAAKENIISEPNQPIILAAKEKSDFDNSDASAPKTNIPYKLRGEDVIIELGDRNYRIRGLQKNNSFDVLKINICASSGDFYHIDSLDVYQAKQRTAFINTAAAELKIKADIIKRDIGRIMLKLEELQEARINEVKQVKEKSIMPQNEKQEALNLLKAPDLIEQLKNSFKHCGIVGEENNLLMGYLAAVSRKLEEPLAVIIQSSSAAGKTSLMDTILSFIPDEERVKYSAVTGQALFYMGETSLKHKILAVVEEQGAERASYALKLLQSEGELTIASTGKDSNGRLITQEYRVEGPVMIFLTTTAIDLDEELRNRCLILSVNEDQEQTQAIHKMQRELQTLEGLKYRQQKKETLKLHQNAQRLLKPLMVVNPHANELTFMSSPMRTRRDNKKYLTLINAVTLLHQYQRLIKTLNLNGKSVRYIETTWDDIDIAHKLANEVLGRSLDELSPQTRRLLFLLEEMVKEIADKKNILLSDVRFNRKQIREYTGWSDFQVRIHLQRLYELEYVNIYQGRNGQRFVYVLEYNGEGKDGKPFFMGLADIEQIKKIQATKKNLGN